MNIFTWIAVAVAVIALITLISGLIGTSDTALAIGATGLVLASVIGAFGVMPEWRLYRATVEKRILVEQARAEADSAVEYKRAEITRAEGVAEANRIIAGSITEPYLRYLFVNNLGETENQIIYVPTEANLPILEADRFGENRGEGEDE